MQGYSQSNPLPKKIDGIEVLKVHKANEFLESIPVAKQNTSRKAPNLTDCYNDGLNPHGVKSVGINVVVKAVSQLGFFGRRSTNLR
jgi:hypothetical protein